MFDCVIKNATVVFPHKKEITDVAITNGVISAFGNIADQKAKSIIDAKGLHLLAGVIDSQVHFREPGFEYKEDLESGTRSAVMGGVTAIMEMPNTNPATISQEALEHKVAIANKTAWCDFAFFIGGHVPTTKINWSMLENLPAAAGIKIFMGSSTGNLLVESDNMIRDILINSRRRIAIHAEDEARLKERANLAEAKQTHTHPIWRDEQTAVLATKRILNLAKTTNRSVHILHITTADELPIIAQNKRWATMEVTPQHLSLDASMYDKLGGLMQMNPPIRDKHHQDALWQAINSGLVDVVGSDHAPHSLEEKAKDYPNSPSGMPGVQTMLPVMLNHVNNGKLSIFRLTELLSSAPARVYNIANKGRIAIGCDADFALVDLAKKYTINNADMQYKCGWTPYDGMKSTGKVTATMVRGVLVMQAGELLAKNAAPLRFL